jgi:hypothetical protein
MKTYIKILLGVVMFIGLAAILAALYMYNLKHTDMAKAKPDFAVTATALLKEFEDNEAAASAKYINKIVELTGTVATVKPAENNIVNISLVTESDLSSVICTFAAISDPSSVKAGDEITIRGECSGFLMDVLLNNCAILK